MMRVKLPDEEKKYQSQRLLEKQLVSLIRQYFTLDKAYAYSQFTKGSVLIKADKVIDIFQKEHANILLSLQRAIAPGRIRDDEKLFEELSTLVDQYSSFQEIVYQYNVYLEEIETERKVITKEVNRLQKLQYTDRQHEERVRHAIKTIETLENKLETQMIRFGTICTENKELRKELDHLLWQRMLFMDQWNKMIDKLSEGKKIMLDLIEQATIAYNQREEWCTKLTILRQKAIQDLATNRDAMRQNKRSCEKNSKLTDFVWIKGQKRIMRDLEFKLREKRRLYEKNVTKKLEDYRHMLSEIQNFTKENKIKIIAKKFIIQEESNMSKFKYVLDLIYDIEKMGDKLSRLYEEVDEKKLLNETRRLQQKTTLENIEFNLDDAVNEAKQAEKFLNETDTLLNNFLSGVSDLFYLCKCNKDPVIKLLGNNTEVNKFNVYLYIQVLEQKVQSLLITAGYRNKTTNKTKFIQFEQFQPKIFTIDEIVKATPCSLCVEHEMVSDVIDVLQRVWSKNEAQGKLRARLKLPGGKLRLHTISNCQIPKARRTIQQRYE